MQPRLRRSRTEVVIAGVCGGLADYFGVDPVIVRLVFALITLTTGIGFLAYPVLWLVMPKADSRGNTGAPFPINASEWRRRAGMIGQEAAELGQHAAEFGEQIGRDMREVFVHGQQRTAQSRVAARPFATAEPPPPEAYKFDPLTGQPLSPSESMQGQTINLGADGDPSHLTTMTRGTEPFSRTTPARPRRNRGHVIGIALLAIGTLVLADHLGISTDFVFPVMMIIAGVLLLRRT